MRACLPHHGSTKHNNVRLDFLQVLVAQSKPHHRTAGEVLGNDIGPGNEPFGYFNTFGMGDVEGHALLAGVNGVENTAAVKVNDIVLEGR